MKAHVNVNINNTSVTYTPYSIMSSINKYFFTHLYIVSHKAPSSCLKVVINSLKAFSCNYYVQLFRDFDKFLFSL